MAVTAINNMHAQRETFKDKDCVRIHQIINRGGDIVNSVPDSVELETTVRARNLGALYDANDKVNRSIRGAAIAIGGKAIVEDSPGQMPMNPDKTLGELFTQNAQKFYSPETILPCYETTSSTDMGDLSLIMPALHGIVSGIEGGLHSKDYRITNYDDALIIPTKILACMIVDLLFDGAAGAQKVQKNFKPQLSKEQYLETIIAMEKQTVYE